MPEIIVSPWHRDQQPFDAAVEEWQLNGRKVVAVDKSAGGTVLTLESRPMELSIKPEWVHDMVTILREGLALMGMHADLDLRAYLTAQIAAMESAHA